MTEQFGDEGLKPPGLLDWSRKKNLLLHKEMGYKSLLSKMRAAEIIWKNCKLYRDIDFHGKLLNSMYSNLIAEESISGVFSLDAQKTESENTGCRFCSAVFVSKNQKSKHETQFHKEEKKRKDFKNIPKKAEGDMKANRDRYEQTLRTLEEIQKTNNAWLVLQDAKTAFEKHEKQIEFEIDCIFKQKRKHQHDKEKYQFQDCMDVMSLVQSSVIPRVATTFAIADIASIKCIRKLQLPTVLMPTGLPLDLDFVIYRHRTDESRAVDVLAAVAVTPNPDDFALLFKSYSDSFFALADGKVLVDTDFVLDEITSLHFDSQSFRTYLAGSNFPLMRSIHFISEDRPLTNVSSEMKEVIIRELSNKQFLQKTTEDSEKNKAVSAELELSVTSLTLLEQVELEEHAVKMRDLKISAKLKQYLLGANDPFSERCTIEMLKVYFDSDCIGNISILKRRSEHVSLQDAFGKEEVYVCRRCGNIFPNTSGHECYQQKKLHPHE